MGVGMGAVPVAVIVTTPTAPTAAPTASPASATFVLYGSARAARAADPGG
jgi:hypothetical protein